MRPPEQLVYSRARVQQRYALFPLEGYPLSRLPSWPDADVRTLASPALGASFVQYLIDLKAGGSGSFAADDAIETFYYMLSGAGECTAGKTKRELRPGSFALIAPETGLSIKASEATRLVALRKRYETAPGIVGFQSLFGEDFDVKTETWANNPASRLQTLIPDELQYDLAMNVFTFDPGHGLPYVETHVMEHGLLFLEGKGMYFLDGQWMEVEKDDFLWMGPYCPQSFYATGPKPAKYLYYKNVNREVPL